MHIFFKGQVFCCGQSASGRGDPLYYRVICQVCIHDHFFKNSRLLEAFSEKFCFPMLNAHGSKYYCKIILLAFGYLCLPYDLCRQFVMRQTIPRKYRQLLTSYESCQSVYRRYSGLDKVSWIESGNGIHRAPVYIILLPQVQRSTVCGLSDPIECSSQYLFG
ncbi:hypothetical protein SDC9_181384 [bioreactor metagenome]|uniref:Uncharacterized protein n=1 Tax=bioreactor metagenome TaxID=1076179 RepID=A0A645H6C0_9ZZZZ